jgi:hypothetical protein
MPTTLRYTTDHTVTASRGNVFAPLWWDIRLPSIEGGQLHQGELTLDNTGQQPIASLRTATAPINVLLELVLGNDATDTSAQDRVEYSAQWQILPEAEYGPGEIRARLGASTILDDSYPGRRFTPNTWPGCFAILLMLLPLFG